MGESSSGPKFAGGSAPPETPSVPIPGKPNPDKGSDDSGVPVWVKVAGGVVGILATLAGIGFGLEEIVQSNRNYLQHEAEADRVFKQQQASQEQEFKKELEKQQQLADAQQAGHLADQKRADADKARADADKALSEAKIEESKQKEADADARRVEAERGREESRLADARVKDDVARTEERRKQEAEQLTQLQSQISKLRLAKSPDEAFNAVTAITGALGGEEDVRRIALQALETRLEEFPPEPEITLIFLSLPDAGPEALEVEARVNRKAWRMLRLAMSDLNECDAGPRGPDCDAADFRLKMLALEALGREGYLGQLENDITAAYNSPGSGISHHYFRHKTNPSLRVVARMLGASRDAIERTLSEGAKGARANLNGCFLPNFAPDRPSPVAEISLVGSYLGSADLRGLERAEKEGPVLIFGRLDDDLAPKPDPQMLLDNSPGVVRVPSEDLRYYDSIDLKLSRSQLYHLRFQ
jgi:hypothetical protein